MSIGDASAAQTLIQWLITQPDAASDTGRTVTDQQATDAAAYLAKRSHAVLHAGQRDDAVYDAWPLGGPPPRFVIPEEPCDGPCLAHDCTCRRDESNPCPAHDA
jgi:hypothetical protein